MNVLEWLDLKRQDGLAVKERFAELIAVNFGTMTVSEFGNIRRDTGSPYGRVGLTVIEAMELCMMTGQYQGLMLACGENEIMAKAAAVKIQNEIDRKKQEMESGGTGGGAVILATEKDVKDMEVIMKRVKRGQA